MKKIIIAAFVCAFTLSIAYAAQNSAASIRNVRDPVQLQELLNSNSADAQSRLAAIEATAVGSALAPGYIIVGNASTVSAAVAVSGDIGITSAGVAAISSNVIVDADIKTNALIAATKLSVAAQASLALADSALQPAGNLTGSIGAETTAVATVVSGAALGTTSLQPNAVNVTNVIVSGDSKTNTIIVLRGLITSWTVSE